MYGTCEWMEEPPSELVPLLSSDLILNKEGFQFQKVKRLKGTYISLSSNLDTIVQAPTNPSS